MVSMFASSTVDRGFEPRSVQTKDYQKKYVAYAPSIKEKEQQQQNWLAWNQDNVSEWGDMSFPGLLFQ